MIAPLLVLPGLAFEALLRLRSRMYAASWLPQHRLLRPVISIGNITMGGAGKTPLVIYVAQALINLGFTPAVLSRGYGRRAPNQPHILRPGREILPPACYLGDEPALIRHRVPSIWMGISKNRFTAGSEISRQQAGLTFILDDGFQHRKLHRDLDIVVIDQTQPLGPNRVFPRGTLREPLSELRRCHVVVINGSFQAETSDPVEKEIRLLHPKAKIFLCRQAIGSLIPFPKWKEAGEPDTPGALLHSAYLVAAIGNPERFQRDVQQLGIEVRGTRFFADHYKLKQSDWIACAHEARLAAADAVITTEKDAIKISRPPDFPLLVSVQSTDMLEAKEFDCMLKDCIEEQP